MTKPAIYRDQVIDLEYARRVQREMATDIDLIEIEGDHFVGWSRPHYMAKLLANWYRDELEGNWDIRR